MVQVDPAVACDILGFSAEQVCRLTGLSMRQLRYWDQTGFFSPGYGDPNRRQPFGRVYSFRDLVGLRAIAILRNTHRVPLQELRKVGSWLQDSGDEAWTSATFHVVGRRVFFERPEDGAPVAGRPLGQTAFPFQMQKVAHEMQGAVAHQRDRCPDDVGRIVQNRYLVHNAPVLAGTRIPTSAVWNLHQAGYGVQAIIREYPRLTTEDVRAALAFEEQRRRKRAS